MRDSGSPIYVLTLNGRLIGESRCNADNVFRKIKHLGHHGRQAGGVCEVEMVLMDLAGKAYGTPAYKLVGGVSFATRSFAMAIRPQKKRTRKLAST